MVTKRAMKRGQVVLYQGEAVLNVFVVKQGIARAYIILENGNEVIVALFGPGDYFPETLPGEAIGAAMFYYDMMTDGELEVWTQDVHAKQHHDDAHSYEKTQRRYLGALLHINALAQANALDRLAHTMRYLALRFGVPTTNKSFTQISLKLTQLDLAQLCNLSRETINQELKKLKERNIVVARQKYYAVNVRALMKMIDDDIAVDLTD